MKYIKTCLFFLGVLLGLALMGFFGLMCFVGVYEVFVYLFKHCPELLVNLVMVVVGVSYISVGWSIFCKCVDKLRDS